MRWVEREARWAMMVKKAAGEHRFLGIGFGEEEREREREGRRGGGY